MTLDVTNFEAPFARVSRIQFANRRRENGFPREQTLVPFATGGEGVRGRGNGDVNACTRYMESYGGSKRHIRSLEVSVEY